MTNEEKLWQALYGLVHNAFGTAGLLGNLDKESGLNSKNVQNSCEKAGLYGRKLYRCCR